MTPPSEPPHDAPTPDAHRPVRTSHRPVWRPWQPATTDPEIIGGWGDKLGSTAPPRRPSHRQCAIAGALVAAALTGIVVWQAAPGTDRHSFHAAPVPLNPTPPLPPADIARHAAETARTFLAATTIEERSRFVRHPDITRSRMLAWHPPDQPLPPLTALGFHDRWAEETIGPHSFVMLYMEMTDFTTRAIALERSPDGSFLVDWESFELWSEVPWDTFLDSTPTHPIEFRLIAEHDAYYNFEFTNADAWACFRLSDPANRAHAWGYCATDSDTAQALGRVLRRQRRHGTPQAKVILRLRFPTANPAHRQLLIEELVQEHWLKPDP